MKKFRQNFPLIIVVVVFLVLALASSQPRYIADTKYNAFFKCEAQKDEVVKNASKLQFLKKSSNPTIVLRVPHATRAVLDEDKNVKTEKNYDGSNNLNDINIYNVIEKEMLKGGFTVRDRALFDKVLSDKSVNDYSKIKDLTETDLILELSSIQFVKYPLNHFDIYTKGKRGKDVQQTITCTNYFSLYGIKLEFRLIRVKENDFIGSFTYNYVPNENGVSNFNINVSSTNSCSEPFLYQGNVVYSKEKLIPQQDIENFVKIAAQKMVNEILN